MNDVVREYVYESGITPTGVDSGRSYPRGGSHYANREVFQREDGRWVVRWTFRGEGSKREPYLGLNGQGTWCGRKLFVEPDGSISVEEKGEPE